VLAIIRHSTAVEELFADVGKQLLVSLRQMSVGDIASILGLLLNIAGMFWFKRKGGKYSRALVPFCTLGLLTFTQSLSMKLIGKELFPRGVFGSLVVALAIGIYWLARDEEP